MRKIQIGTKILVDGNTYEVIKKRSEYCFVLKNGNEVVNFFYPLNYNFQIIN